MTQSDPFPPTPRVHYRNAPLLQVVCQIRYPAILRIESEPPVQFQEVIRHAFPLVERAQNLAIPQLPPEILQALGASMGGGGWTFLTENRSVLVGLGSDSFSLTVTSYERWEAFRKLLFLPLDALTEIYKPAFFTRVGLRYMDLIVRSKLGIPDMPWSQLLRREVLGEMADTDIEANLVDVRKAVRLRIPSINGTVFLQHGFGRTADDTETGYMIDLDFSSESKTEALNVRSVLENLHRGGESLSVVHLRHPPPRP